MSDNDHNLKKLWGPYNGEGAYDFFLYEIVLYTDHSYAFLSGYKELQNVNEEDWNQRKFTI